MEKNLTTTKYEMVEMCFPGPTDGNPFLDVVFQAEFTYLNRTLYVDGFYDGNGIYKLRFMPDSEGVWKYFTRSNIPCLDSIAGQIQCLPAKKGVHGPVRVHNTFHFCYDDGTPYRPVGTTCYVWNHQPAPLRDKTIQTLKSAPFNKIRMCIFPKDYEFNKNEPEVFPFECSESGGFDFTRFNPKYWRILEECIRSLEELNIEADIILFHPYDRWGFSGMDVQTDDRYLKYTVARLASFRNVWWSFANEYDLMTSKTVTDWDRFFQIVQSCDPYQRLRSIHNCSGFFYDHGKPWVTHCSIQSSDLHKAEEWRNCYRKPVIVDECCYEGDIDMNWGNISAEEMVSRFWYGFVGGIYVGHGETYINDREELWWSKGGELVGESPARIAFFKKILDEAPEGFAPLIREWKDRPLMGVEGEYYLHYTGTRQPSFRRFELPENAEFGVEIVDTWNMEIQKLTGTVSGNVTISLPGRKYLAVIFRRVN